MRILLTNLRMAKRTGTELYVRDLALEFSRRGELPVVYSPQLGELADSLRAASVPVVDDLNALAEAPDVVHGHHSLETMTALLHFPASPGIFVCHDCSAWHDTAPRFPRLRRYVAVDRACRERLVGQEGVPPEAVRILHNAVDLQRFRQRAPLPPEPKSALLFSNYFDASSAEPIAEACRERGLHLQYAGREFELDATPERTLQQADLVFAKGRCAWEAMACGAAVVLCDPIGVGPLVSDANFEELRDWNFGRRLLRDPVSPAVIGRAIDAYDARDARAVSDRLRSTADVTALASTFLELYRDVIDEQRGENADAEQDSRAAAAFLRWWSQERRAQVKSEARERARKKRNRKRNRFSSWFGTPH